MEGRNPMKTRWFAAVVIFLFATSNAFAVQPGDTVFVQLKGKLAREFTRAEVGVPDPRRRNDDDTVVEFGAIVAQRLPDGQLRIETSSSCRGPGGEAGLITFAATIAPTMITSSVTPKGTKVYSSPGSNESAVTTVQKEILRVT